MESTACCLVISVFQLRLYTPEYPFHGSLSALHQQCGDLTCQSGLHGLVLCNRKLANRLKKFGSCRLKNTPSCKKYCPMVIISTFCRSWSEQVLHPEFRIPSLHNDTREPTTGIQQVSVLLVNPPSVQEAWNLWSVKVNDGRFSRFALFTQKIVAILSDEKPARTFRSCLCNYFTGHCMQSLFPFRVGHIAKGHMQCICIRGKLTSILITVSKFEFRSLTHLLSQVVGSSLLTSLQHCIQWGFYSHESNDELSVVEGQIPVAKFVSAEWAIALQGPFSTDLFIDWPWKWFDWSRPPKATTYSICWVQADIKDHLHFHRFETVIGLVTSVQ